MHTSNFVQIHRTVEKFFFTFVMLSFRNCFISHWTSYQHFFHLNRDQHFSFSPSSSSFCFLARTLLRRRQRIRLEETFRLISSTEDDPAVACPSPFCKFCTNKLKLPLQHVNSSISFFQIFSIAFVKIAKEGTMCARKSLAHKFASRVNLKYLFVHSCLTRTRCSKPHLQVSVELPSDDGARRPSEAILGK